MSRRTLFTIQGSDAYLYTGISANNKHHYHHHGKPVSSLQTAQHLECTSCAQTTNMQSNIQIMAKTLHSSTTFIPGALRFVLARGFGQIKAEGEGEDKHDHKRRSEENGRGRKKKEGRRKFHIM